MKRTFTPIVSRFRSRRGLASALIIMLLVLLIFFGVLSLVTTAADFRLAQKRADWNAGYYSADSEAVQLLAALDTCCLTQEGDSLQQDQLTELLGAVLDNDSNVQSWEINPATAGQPALILTALVARDADSGQGISLRLRILTGPLQPGGQHMTIEAWRQWQPEFDYSGTEGGIWKG